VVDQPHKSEPNEISLKQFAHREQRPDCQLNIYEIHHPKNLLVGGLDANFAIVLDTI
jgi:hypothetical protein